MTTMQEVIQEASRLTAGKELVVTTGVGTHQSIVARHFTFDHPRRVLITSTGHGTMGFGVPAAIGAAEAGAELVLCFNGDGSMDVDMPHLMVLAGRHLNVKVIVLDNRRFGIVHQFEGMQGLNHVATERHWKSYVHIAAGLGVPGVLCTSLSAFRRRMAEALEHRGPALLHVPVSETGVWPILKSDSRPEEMTSGRD